MGMHVGHEIFVIQGVIVAADLEFVYFPGEHQIINININTAHNYNH